MCGKRQVIAKRYVNARTGIAFYDEHANSFLSSSWLLAKLPSHASLVPPKNVPQMLADFVPSGLKSPSFVAKREVVQ